VTYEPPFAGRQVCQSPRHSGKESTESRMLNSLYVFQTVPTRSSLSGPSPGWESGLGHGATRPGAVRSGDTAVAGRLTFGIA
jgi:hypothetical protein